MKNIKTIQPLLLQTKKASISIARLKKGARKKLVKNIADAIKSNQSFIIAENKKDVDIMDDDDPKKDRLMLDTERIGWMIADAKKVAELEEYTGKILIERTLENGIKLQKISVPLGVVGIIYESRPNVTLDAICLTLKSGNGVVLRGGSDAVNSNKAIVKIVNEVLIKAGLDSNIVQLLPIERVFVKELLEAEKYVDVIIPRGSQNLINFVRENSKIPTIETGAGVCHTFVEKTADLEMAKNIVLNAKLQRPSVCNALDTILVSEEIAETFLPMIIKEFEKDSVGIFADKKSFEILARYSYLNHAKSEDFGREFLGYGCSIKVVKDEEEALEHIAENSSKHSEAIVTQDMALAERFLTEVDSAAVYHNASTRFTDGGIFGLGAEIGISTQKLHARGPFALEKLVTEKWILRGDGQVR
ncbi:glutamate-5-semialdehyde dehydrogenase [Candidatus Gracilibacteria bacterium]|nr:glutamate-5-semialdehyde dehydrogenase [Candidatus Gracilibacteria bacterium]